MRAQLETMVELASAEVTALQARHRDPQASRAAQDRLSDAVAALAAYLVWSGEGGWISGGTKRTDDTLH